MRVEKKYIAKEEITIYSINTVEIIADSENEAMDLLRDGKGKLINTDIQEQVVDQRWIDSSEPIKYETFDEERLPIG
jgi:hypothetical protein